MINEFLSRNSNLDSIILIVVGVVVGAVSSSIWKYLKLGAKFSFKRLIRLYKFIKRRAAGDYTMNELIKIQEKPVHKQSKKEQAAVEKYNKMMEEYSQTIEEQKIRMGNALNNLNNMLERGLYEYHKK